VVDTLGDFLRDQGAGHPQRLPALPPLVPLPDLGEVLDRADRGVTEGELRYRLPSLLRRWRCRSAESAAPGTNRQ
jgi:hypothetical protein